MVSVPVLQDVHSSQCRIGQLLSAAHTRLHIKDSTFCLPSLTSNTRLEAGNIISKCPTSVGRRTKAKVIGAVTSITGQYAVCPQGETCSEQHTCRCQNWSPHTHTHTHTHAHTHRSSDPRLLRHQVNKRVCTYATRGHICGGP